MGPKGDSAGAAGPATAYLRDYWPAFVLAGVSLVFFAAVADLAWGVIVGAQVHGLDRTVLASLRGSSLSWLHPVLSLYTQLGEPIAAASIVLAVAAIVALLGRPGRALFLFAVPASGALVNTALKELVGRTRPPAMYADIRMPTSWSFPSGHAMFGLTFGLTLAIVVMVAIGWPRGLPVMVALVFFGALLGYSRVFLGVHWFTDVLGGWSLALAWVSVWCAGWFMLLVKRRHRMLREGPRAGSARPLVPPPAPDHPGRQSAGAGFPSV